MDRPIAGPHGPSYGSVNPVFGAAVFYVNLLVMTCLVSQEKTFLYNFPPSPHHPIAVALKPHFHTIHILYISAYSQQNTHATLQKVRKLLNSTLTTIVQPVGVLISEETMSTAPSAPPANMFDTVPGYEGTVAGGGGGYLPPPMPTVPMPVPENAPSHPDWQIPSISEDRAREALRTYVSSKCCYSSAPVNEGVITNMENFHTYRYRLETFTESRSSEWSQEPYTGQTVDAGVQPAPAPWQIAAQPPTFFQDKKQTIKVPYTSSVKNCHACIGMGKSPCTTCAGAGNKVCWSCNGTGHRLNDERCMHCMGRGRENCSSCNGHGSRQCDTCRGKRQLLVFINLNIKWSTEKDDYVAQQSSGLKVQNLESVSGKQLFQDTQYMLYPVMGFPDASVAQASERLVREHQGKYAQNCQMLQQRQTIELIPITRVNYMWKGKSHMYFVYGNEFEVNAEDYPATCCCCSVM